MTGGFYSIKQNLFLPIANRALRRELVDYLKERAKLTGKSFFYEYTNLFKISFYALADYKDCRLLGISSENKKAPAVLTAGRYNRIIKLINNDKADFPKNKAELYKRFQPYLNRQWRTVSKDTPLEEIKEWADRHTVFFAQSPETKRDVLPERISAGFFEDEFDIKQYLVKRGYFLLEEYILSHGDIAALSPDAHHSLLITTFKTGEDVHIFGAALKTGLAEGKDYLVCPVDIQTGKVKGYGQSSQNPSLAYEEHPDSGISFLNLHIPHFKPALLLCETLAVKLGALPFLSFEFAIGERNLMLIDINPLPDHRIHQMAEKRGLYQEFAALARKYVKKKEENEKNC